MQIEKSLTRKGGGIKTWQGATISGITSFWLGESTQIESQLHLAYYITSDLGSFDCFDRGSYDS